MNLPQLVANVCGFILLLSIGYFTLSSPERVDLGAPSIKGEPVQELVAKAPVIGDLKKEFDVNIVNPFVPISDRDREGQEIRDRLKPRPKPGPVIAEPAQPPPPPLPKLNPKKANVPQCAGLIAHESGRHVLVVNMEGSPTTYMHTGDNLNNWVLLDISNGSARFRDPSGKESTFVIGASAGTTVPVIPKAEAEPGPAPMSVEKNAPAATPDEQKWPPPRGTPPKSPQPGSPEANGPGMPVDPRLRPQIPYQK